MRYLFDSHLLVWLGFFPDRVPLTARSIIESDNSVALFSRASLWELTIKQALKRPDFDVDVAALRQGMVASAFKEVDVRGNHALAVGNLLPVHRDPFDRMLIAQSRVEGATFVTTDRRLGDYGDWVLTV